jgi:ABC-2 family transporter protein
MIWLTWRQFRVPAAAIAAALAALAVVLALTGPGLADDYSSGIADCTQSGDCSDFVDRFFQDHQGTGFTVTAVVLVLPALIGLFWGAPLIARELEAGTYRLVWNQSVTRTRWLAVKLGLVGLAAITVAGLGTFAVDWWSDPIDKAAAAADDISRMEPLLFGTRGIVPMGYAAFAFALGVTVGMLIRRTLPAMAITLAVFVAIQLAMPQLVRPHLIAPAHSTVEITTSNFSQLLFGPDHRVSVSANAAEPGAWVLSSHTVDANGRAVDTIPPHRSLSLVSGPCAPPEREPAAQALAKPGEEAGPCLAEITRLGYRQRITYQPAGRFWAFQWYETGIYTALALGLAGFCFWWLRRRVS